MLKLKKWLLSLLAMAVIAVPAMAGNNDAKTANGNTANTTSAEASPAAPSPILNSTSGDANVSTSSPDPEPAPQAGAAPMGAPPPVPPVAVVPALVPVRVFPIDPPKTGGLAGIKAGPITLAPYGFIKATVVHDSSDPNGDDFPFPGIWLSAGPNSTFNTGPTKDPEVHVKARATRFGLNLEWPDMSPKLTLTGKIEGDFEGNFSEVDNRDVSSIRSNEPQLRLAYVRIDYHASDATDLFFVGGQDWTLFGSGALTNMLETTFNAAFSGDVYTRSPQLRLGFVQTLSHEHKVKLEGQFGIMMPSTGQILKLGNAAGNGLGAQIGEGEREGADADRPEWEGRAALSFQLDNAKGVAPAQIALAGFRSKRTSIVPNGSYSDGSGACDLLPDPNYCVAFPNGFQSSSTLWGNQLTVQLPTRWFTLVGSAYRGGDMRFYFGGQINSYFTDVKNLYNVSSALSTADGGPLAAQGGAQLGCNVNPGDGNCPVGNVVVAPERPIRAFGGFVQLGLPLSRWFNANPNGHNAGWQLYLAVGKDQVVDRDQNQANGNTCVSADYVKVDGKVVSGTTCNGGLPLSVAKVGIATLYYKFNNWCQFGFEQSVYATRIYDKVNLYTIAGTPSNEWQDHRTEFGPIFTF